ncbi:Major facilitator superfamily domain-containing protein 6-like protein B [Armadillidium vulgare]|nr:Major facilitator superfamily domain-containing protein 6-like protein B [Armadillidium vulgare]
MKELKEYFITVNQILQNFKDGHSCVTHCKATALREDICKNNVSIEVLNPSLTFYSHLAIRLFKEFTLSSSMPLLDGAAVTILKEHNGDFGFQRMFANLGMMIMSPISGMLIDYFSIQNGFDDFRPAMYMYCALKLIAAVIILFLNLDFKQASNKVISEFSSMLLNPEVVCFLLATILAGTCYGYIETFLFWLLEDLGADRKLMGLTLTVGCLFGIPLLMISTFILKKIGHVNTIAVGFCVYVVRLLGYTFIPGPWWAMPFEALECATVSLMVVSFMSYASVLSTPATVVTLQGMYGGLYNGVGRGAGSLIGGFLIDRLGMFNAFRIIAALAGCCGIVYFVVNFLFFRGNRQLRDEAMIQEKELRKAKEAEANKQPVNLSKVIESKKEIIKDMFIIAPSDLKENPKDLHSKTNLAFEGENIILLSAVTASAGLAGLLFLLVPPARIIHSMPNILPIEISCSEGQGANLRIAPPYICEPKSDIDLFSIQVDAQSLVIIQKALLTIPDSNLKCKNSTNCYDEDNLIKSNSNNVLKVGETASIDDPIYSLNVIKRINSSYESDSLLCPNLDKNFKDGHSCVTHCKATALREDVCKNNVSIEVLNPSLTFYSHLAIRLFKEFTFLKYATFGRSCCNHSKRT